MFRNNIHPQQKWSPGEAAIALSKSAEQGREDVVKFSLLGGVYSTQTSSRGRTVLDAAKHNTETKIVQLFESYSADATKVQGTYQQMGGRARARSKSCSVVASGVFCPSLLRTMGLLKSGKSRL